MSSAQRVGIARSTHGPDEGAELVRVARDEGFDGIQLKTMQLRAWNYEPEAYVALDPDAARLARAGVVFHPGADFNTWEPQTARVRRFAEAVSSEHVCYVFDPLPELGHTVDTIVDELDRVGARYRADGVAFSFHNHRNSMLASQHDLETVCGRLDPAHCGLTYDTAHAALSGVHDLGASLRALGASVTNVHLKDVASDGSFCPLGMGELALADVVEALSDIGYSGWLIVDDESKGFSTAEACEISMRFLVDLGVRAS